MQFPDGFVKNWNNIGRWGKSFSAFFWWWVVSLFVSTFKRKTAFFSDAILIHPGLLWKVSGKSTELRNWHGLFTRTCRTNGRSSSPAKARYEGLRLGRPRWKSTNRPPILQRRSSVSNEISSKRSKILVEKYGTLWRDTSLWPMNQQTV